MEEQTLKVAEIVDNFVKFSEALSAMKKQKSNLEKDIASMEERIENLSDILVCVCFEGGEKKLYETDNLRMVLQTEPVFTVAKNLDDVVFDRFSPWGLAKRAIHWATLKSWVGKTVPVDPEAKAVFDVSLVDGVLEKRTKNTIRVTNK